MESRILKKPITSVIYCYQNDGDSTTPVPILMGSPFMDEGCVDPNSISIDGGYANPNTMFTDGSIGGMPNGMIPTMNHYQSEEFGYNDVAYDHFGPTVNDLAGSLTSPNQVTDLAKVECGICGTVLQKKSYKRHMRTVHATDETPRYKCKCGTEEVRKDNHKRHVGTCRVNGPDHYVCICGNRHGDKDGHLKHVIQCLASVE